METQGQDTMHAGVRNTLLVDILPQIIKRMAFIAVGVMVILRRNSILLFHG
jgi:hypothetical protein